MSNKLKHYIDDKHTRKICIALSHLSTQREREREREREEINKENEKQEIQRKDEIKKTSLPRDRKKE